MYYSVNTYISVWIKIKVIKVTQEKEVLEIENESRQVWKKDTGS